MERLSAKSKTNWQRIAHDLMRELFYPAVLGGIILNTFVWIANNPELIIAQWPLVFLSISIIVHYLSDFIYTWYFERYTLIAFVLDLSVISLLFLAISVIKINDGNADIETIKLCFLATYVLFFLIDLFTIWGQKRALRTLIIEFIISVAFLVSYVYNLLDAAQLGAFIVLVAVILFALAPKPEAGRTSMVIEKTPS